MIRIPYFQNGLWWNRFFPMVFGLPVIYLPCPTPYADRSPISGTTLWLASPENCGTATPGDADVTCYNPPKFNSFATWKMRLTETILFFWNGKFSGAKAMGYQIFTSREYQDVNHRLQPGGIPASNVSGDGPTTPSFFNSELFPGSPTVNNVNSN